MSTVERGGIALPKGKRPCRHEPEALCPLGRVAQLHYQVRAKWDPTRFLNPSSVLREHRRLCSRASRPPRLFCEDGLNGEF